MARNLLPVPLPLIPQRRKTHRANGKLRARSQADRFILWLALISGTPIRTVWLLVRRTGFRPARRKRRHLVLELGITSTDPSRPNIHAVRLPLVTQGAVPRPDFQSGFTAQFHSQLRGCQDLRRFAVGVAKVPTAPVPGRPANTKNRS